MSTKMKHTIKDLSEGRVQAYFSEECELEDLRKLMKLSFPYSPIVNGSFIYYFSSLNIKGRWKCSNDDFGIPIQKVSDFDLEDEWIPVQGEVVNVWNNINKPPRMEQRIYLYSSKLSKELYPIKCVDMLSQVDYNNGEDFLSAGWKNISQIKKKKTITIQQIADKFGYPVDEIEIENLKQ